MEETVIDQKKALHNIQKTYKCGYRKALVDQKMSRNYVL